MKKFRHSVPTLREYIHFKISELSMKSRYVLLKKTLLKAEVGRANKRTAKEIEANIQCQNKTDLRRITNNVIVSISLHQQTQMLELAERLVKKESKK